MSYSIKQAPLGARLGTSLGQGLAEQVPKEVDRYRLSKGLEKFSQESKGKSPLEQYSMLMSIPGIKESPQALQTFGDLARMQMQQQGFASGAGESPSLSRGGVPGGGEADDMVRSLIDQQEQPPGVAGEQPQIEQTNILDEKALANPPWTPEQRNSKVSDYIDIGFYPEQAQSLAADDEKRFRETPEIYEKRFNQLQEKKSQAREELLRMLQTKTQKKGEELFKDITGEMLINIERGMERDLRLNPNKTLTDIADDWSKKGLETAKAKTQFKKLAKTTGIESFFKGKQTLNNLNNYSDIFRKSGNSEEYDKILQSDMGLSPQASASIAYKPSKEVKGYLSNFKPRDFKDVESGAQYARKKADEISKLIKPNDSLGQIAWEMRRADPGFDQVAFFEQLSANKENLSLNERQERELAEGASDWRANWHDILIFPLKRGR